jgi:hypothetical protein
MSFLKNAISTAVLAIIATAANAAITGGNGFNFDPQNGGYLANGTNDAYDGAYYLYVNGSVFSAAGTVSSDGRAVNYTATMSDLKVTRSFYVPATTTLTGADYGRYVDCVENTGTSAANNVTVGLASNLGSDGATVLVTTSDGNANLTKSDVWAVTDDADGSGDPSLAHVFGRGVDSITSSTGSDALTWNFTNLTINPGKKLCYVTYVVQATSRQLAQQAATSIYATPDLSRIPAKDVKSLKNIQTFATIDVFPPADSVIPSTASFDTAFLITANDSAFGAYTVQTKLNKIDVSAQCSAVENLNNSAGAAIGRVVRCTGLSQSLVTGANTVSITFTSGGKSVTESAKWSVKPVTN